MIVLGDYQIFISYRRDGGEFLAGRLSDKLNNNGYDVFYDIESMRAGKFNEQIYAAIDQCLDVLLVLPPNALDRCSDEEDWVRKEIEYALKKDKNIIPLLMPGFRFPDNLPESIASIAMQEGVLVNSNYFDAMISRIQTLLRSEARKKREDDNEDIIKGIRFLNKRMYKQALSCFENVILENISEPQAYFYAAIAKMEGKRPFLLSRAMINEVESYIESANAYGECGLYFYFQAYIKYDYFAKKMLKAIPTHDELLARARGLGVSESQVNELFELLNTQRPEGF